MTHRLRRGEELSKTNENLVCSHRGIEYHAENTGGSMDFIERLFGVSPDGGDGSLEFVYAVSVLAAIVLVSYVLHRRGSRRDFGAGVK
jgi:hypothetical protein